MLHLLQAIRSDDPAPRHKRVQSVLRGLVNSGQLAPGDKIAAEVQIANALGVSKMTVNKALLALAADGVFVREVGRGTFVAPASPPSIPQKTPVSVSSNKPLTIALSFVEGARNVLDSDYYGALYRGISDAIDNAPDIYLHIPPVGAADYVVEQERAPADGRLVVAPRRESAASLDALWQAGHPLVVLGASWPGMRVPCVDSDNAQGAQAAVAHLIAQGHTRIALLYTEPETANTQDRMRGYWTALQTAGLSAAPAYEVEAEAVWKAGDAARRRLSHLVRVGDAGGAPVTAIFAAGYYLALEAMNAVRGAGLRVPEDVSVVGFDDPLSAHLVFPPLTTVRQPLHAMGKRAGELLLEMVRGKTPKAFAPSETLPAELVVRGSTTAAPLLVK